MREFNLDKIKAADKARIAKAWVNFNGSGTVAIRDNYNVSSITDVATGKYTVNFSTAMADANYSAVMYQNSYQQKNIQLIQHTFFF